MQTCSPGGKRNSGEVCFSLLEAALGFLTRLHRIVFLLPFPSCQTALPDLTLADLHTLADFSSSLGHLDPREGAGQAGPPCSV